ncbi:MAG: spore coat protein CotJB [Faecalibacterium sp.]|nr:spore coat protein CotJB [Ruminococcus sp.]MCM1486582.1 spore coat protein CotJB [Faecalibacterium sp.]
MTLNTNNLKHQLMAIRFSMWDLHLYLDSHPCDTTAAELLEKYKKRYAQMLEQYECNYGPLNNSNGFGSDWTQGPWPWDNRGDC